MLKRWQFWVGLVISAVFLYFSLRGLKLGEVWKSIQSANYPWLLPGIAVYFVGVWVRSWRWHYLLRPLKKIPTATMFPIVTIGYMGNNIYPARAGEVLRAVILKQREDVPVSASLATVIVERIFDGVVMLGFVFINLPELARLTRRLGPGGHHGHPHPGGGGLGGLHRRAGCFSCWPPCFPLPPKGWSTVCCRSCPKKSAPPRAISPCVSCPGSNRCARRWKH